MKILNKTSSQLSKLIKNNTPFLLLILIVVSFFYKTIIFNKIPLPGDFVVGVYYPWLDYKWGYPAGVPVKNPITTDVVSLIFPEQMLGIDLLRNGQWPLWNHNILAGTPLFANLQAAPFSPTNFVYFIFDKLTAWSLQIILQHILAAAFMYILLRRWKLNKYASVIGGAVFAFSGFNMIFSQWNGHTLSSAFIPLVIFFADRILQKGNLLDMFGLAITFTFQLFSGYPQTNLYTAVALGIFVLFNLSQINKKTFTFFALSAIFALGLSAVQLMPTKELWRLSQRAYEPHPFEWAFLPWNKIITLIAPDYFGNHATANYWGPQDYTSNTAYVGVVAFMLGLLSINLFNTKKQVKYLIFLALFSLFMSFPFFLPVAIWKYDIFGMRASSAHRITILFTFAFSGLAAFGWQYLQKSKTKIKLPVFTTGLLLGVYLLATFYLNLKYPDTSVRGIFKYKVGLRNLVLPLGIYLLTSISFLFSSKKKLKKIFSFLIFTLLIFELFRFGWKYTPFTSRQLAYPTTPVIEFLQQQSGIFRVSGNKVIPVNLRTAYNLESLEGYETIHPLLVSQFLSAINSNQAHGKPVGRYGMVDNLNSRLLNLVNTKYILVLTKDTDNYDVNKFNPVFTDKSVTILQNSNALPRAFMVYNWQIDKPENTLSILLDPKFPLEKQIIINESIPFSTNPDGSGEVEYEKYSSQESVIKVNTASDGLLFISDSFYPGWHAYVNNVEVPIIRANYMFRAIPIPAGQHSVKMIYKPQTFYTGLKISIITFVLVVLSTICYILKKCWAKSLKKFI